MKKSNSVPNFFFEKPIPKCKPEKRNSFIITTQSEKNNVSYGDFINNNKNATRSERRNAIKRFYDMLFKS